MEIGVCIKERRQPITNDEGLKREEGKEGGRSRGKAWRRRCKYPNRAITYRRIRKFDR
jgi:hypothetical protein